MTEYFQFDEKGNKTASIISFGDAPIYPLQHEEKNEYGKKIESVKVVDGKPELVFWKEEPCPDSPADIKDRK